MNKICPACKRPRPKGYLKEMRKRQGAAIKAALASAKANGDPIGRKRNVHYEWIWQLRDEGKTMSEIAKQLGISRGSVQHAMRVRTK